MSLCWPRRLLQYDNSEAESLGGWGYRGFNKHASYGRLVAFNFPMQIRTGLNFETNTHSGSLLCAEAVPPAVEGTVTCRGKQYTSLDRRKYNRNTWYLLNLNTLFFILLQMNQFWGSSAHYLKIMLRLLKSDSELPALQMKMGPAPLRHAHTLTGSHLKIKLQKMSQGWPLRWRILAACGTSPVIE